MPMGKRKVWWWVVISGNQWTRLVLKRLSSISKMKNCVITNKSPEKSRYHSTQRAAYSGENPPHGRGTHPVTCSFHQYMLPSPWCLSSRCQALEWSSSTLYRATPYTLCVSAHYTWTHPHGAQSLTRGQTLQNNTWRCNTGEGNRVC